MLHNLRQRWNRRPKRRQRISYGRKIRYNWNSIENLNNGFGITRDSCIVDNNGYLRWKSSNRLCHRDITFNYVYKKGSFTNQFSDYDVHHKDGNKFNNNPDNLDVVFREEHEIKHGKAIYMNGIKYLRLAPANRRRKQTHKAILIGGRFGEWYPKSQLIEKYGYLYATEWIYKKKHI